MKGIECAFGGRAGGDPDRRMVKGGTLPMASFAVAVETGTEETTWVRVTVFGEKAEALAVAKGDRVYVEGRLTLDRWQAADGAERVGLSCVASLVQPLGRIGRRRPMPAQRRDGAPAARAAQPAAEFNDKVPW